MARILSLLVVLAAGLMLLLPGKTASGRPGDTGAPAASRLPGGQVPTPSGTSQPFGGTGTVGALFTITSAGKLNHHFCTATVVHSEHGDLAVTAAHCMGRPGTIAFVPGYADGRAPYGTWTVTAVYTGAAWRSSKDPDDDVAFLRISRSGKRPLEAVTGAEQLGSSPKPPALVEVVAYPAKSGRPVWCVNWLSYHRPAQLQFDCGGYPNGTSGGPFLSGLSPAGKGTVVGVIGGDDQGGPSASVSYSPVFGPAVIALYRQAQAEA
jgi:hypothetical protein